MRIDLSIQELWICLECIRIADGENYWSMEHGTPAEADALAAKIEEILNAQQSPQ